MASTQDLISRRTALAQAGRLLIAAAVLPRDWRWMVAKPFPHPDPRPGITGANVLHEDELGTRKAVREAYAAARAYPQLFDGLFCVCECHENMGHRSLLACFESRQAVGCLSCQEQAVLVERLAKQDKTLDEIRKAIDKKWG
jgi:hypothetical protein